ncbi:DUF732 domain-containing protein, partial [Pseudonocardia lacus]|uniref:DUF732 domain-containing protein n=1 Tax=Pseudonocardia lacus TaxID=2835865 RepID=UPI001BDD1C65
PAPHGARGVERPVAPPRPAVSPQRPAVSRAPGRAAPVAGEDGPVDLTLVRPLVPEARDRTDPEAVLPPGTKVVDIDGRPEGAPAAVDPRAVPAGLDDEAEAPEEGTDGGAEDSADAGANANANANAGAGAEEPMPALSRREVRARRATRHRPRRGPIAVAAAVALLGVAGLVTTLGSEPAPEPRPAAPAVAQAMVPTPPPARPTATAAPGVVAGEAVRAAADPTSQQGTAFLKALREAGIPTSRSGAAETEAAVVICQQIERGTEDSALLRVLPAVLTSITAQQAPTVVEAAREHYC